MTSRIANRERLRQVKDFRGLQFGSISPTDVDAFLEFGDRLFLFVETKRTNAPLQSGQLLALRRLCDACQAAGREAVLLITRHDSDGDIDLASTHVEKLWHRGRWHTMKGWTLREAVDYLREKHGG